MHPGLTHTERQRCPDNPGPGQRLKVSCRKVSCCQRHGRPMVRYRGGTPLRMCRKEGTGRGAAGPPRRCRAARGCRQGASHGCRIRRRQLQRRPRPQRKGMRRICHHLAEAPFESAGKAAAWCGRRAGRDACPHRAARAIHGPVISTVPCRTLCTPRRSRHRTPTRSGGT